MIWVKTFEWKYERAFLKTTCLTTWISQKFLYTALLCQINRQIKQLLSIYLNTDV